MSEYSAVRGGKLKLKSGAVGGKKKKKRKRESSKHDDSGEYKHAGKECFFLCGLYHNLDSTIYGRIHLCSQYKYYSSIT